MINFKEIYERLSDSEYLKFDKIQNPKSTAKDVSAFVLLAELFPDKYRIVSAATRSEIFLSVGVQELNEKATKEQAVDLIRCGVRYDLRYDCLSMFV